MGSCADDKASVRAAILLRRNAIPVQERIRRSEAACNRLVQEVKTGLAVKTDAAALGPPQTVPAPTVAVYQCMGSEVDLHSFILAAYHRGWRVAFPCMMKAGSATPENFAGDAVESADEQQRTRMAFRFVSEKMFLEEGADFMQHPLKSYRAEDPALTSTAPCPIDVIDSIIVPMTAFDEKKNRLGYGGGNYDRLLAEKAPATIVVGIAFREQQVDTVPTEPHDRPLPSIIEA